jgi:predicted dehydrogenase
MRILLVGAGVRGRTWAKVCSEASGVELVGILDQDKSRAESVRENCPDPGPVVYPDLRSAIRGGDLDAVIVSTPPDSHHALVSAAFAAGKHVLCEKPLSDEMGEVIDLVQRAQECDRILMVGMNFRYLSTSQRIRQIVQERQLGAVGYGQFTYVRHRDGNRDDLNDYPLTMPYPMLLEQSIHHFDLLRYCYDSEVESLVADSWRPSWSTYEKDCCVSVLFRFENGIRVNYLGTWTASWNKMSFSWRTEFDSGVLIQQSQFDDLVRVDFEPGLGLSGVRFKTADDAEPGRVEKLPPCVPFIDDSRLLLAEFTKAVGGEVEPVTTGRDHLRSLCLVQACIESFESGSWVNLDAFYKKLGIDGL